MAEIYRVEDDTLIINDGVTAIEGEDFHIYNENGVYEDVKDKKFQNVKKVVLPDSVAKIGIDAFYDFQSLEDISLPNSITNIGYDAFADCPSLKSVTIPNSVTNINGYAFAWCKKDAWYKINLTIKCNKGSYAEQYAKENFIPFKFIDKYYIISDTLYIKEGVTSIDGKDFHIYENDTYSSVKEGFADIKRIELPDSITDIGYDAFYGFTSLEDIDFPPEGVTNIGCYAFANCSSLKSIVLPEGLESLEACAFENCTELSDVTIPDSVGVIDVGVFEGCEKLTITCNKGSVAEEFAEDEGIPVKYHSDKKAKDIER